MTLSSVSELEFQKPQHSAYSSAAGANPAAEQQAIRKVRASSYTHSFGGFSFSLNKPEERQQKEDRRPLASDMSSNSAVFVSHGDSSDGPLLLSGSKLPVCPVWKQRGFKRCCRGTGNWQY